MLKMFLRGTVMHQTFHIDLGSLGIISTFLQFFPVILINFTNLCYCRRNLLPHAYPQYDLITIIIIVIRMMMMIVIIIIFFLNRNIID